MPGSRLIALLISPDSWSNRQLLEGISAYARQHARWRFAMQEVTEHGTVDRWVLRAKPAGVIAEITSRDMAKTLQLAGVPIVDILEEHPVPHVPQIVSDDQKVVRAAVDHLVDRGLRHLAFVGDRERHFAKRRSTWFSEYAELRQHQMRGPPDAPLPTRAVAMLSGGSLLSTGVVELAHWLDSLPKPVGVVACNDLWGAQVLRACTEHGIRVPDDIAVIGADDDPIFCHISDPPLTSIDGNAHAIGYAAAAMLDGVISRQERPPPITFVEPGPVHTRGSTDVLMITDREAVAAVRFLREHACAGLTPGVMASRLGMSVRTLERMFTRHLGCSPSAEISRVRLERARDLLATTDLPLADVAQRAGFSYTEGLRRMFQKHFGVAPGGYRRASEQLADARGEQPPLRRPSPARKAVSRLGQTAMNDSLRIALIMSTNPENNRASIDGITAYSKEHGPWRLVLQATTARHHVEPWLQRWKPDGVIARITNERMAASLQKLGVPVIDMLEESGDSGIPRVVGDAREAVRRIVDHLRDRHFRHFAFVGREDRHFAQQRLEHVRDYIHSLQHAMKHRGGAALTFAEIMLPWKSMPYMHVELADWLRALPKPVGVVACNDVWGVQVLRVCHEFDLRVPDDIAVIGLDDDPVMCRTCIPTLSSIGTSARAIGYRAAATIHGMVTRGEVPPGRTLVEPGVVRVRASTDTFAIPDADVVAAIRFLRAHACEHLTIPEVATKLGVSRRTLERDFAQHVGHSPAVEITRARLDRVRELLIATDLPLPVVARRTGFFHAETLHRLFKKQFGATPGEYRRAHRVTLRQPHRPVREMDR